MQFYLGPMSLNVIQAVLDFHEVHPELPTPTFIPSRRQVDLQGGYVSNLTMATLRHRVSHSALIERDHAGPQQGSQSDDGWESLLEDACHADILHIDPWKSLPAYEDGLEWTVAAIHRCLDVNPQLTFEVGTEEAIRRFEVYEVDRLLADLQARLTPHAFAAIRFVVIQCGTALKEGHNTGEFDAERLRRMLEVVASYGKTAKEHNGDWISPATVAAKAAIGLRHINIAPEMGEIESRTLYDMFTPSDKEAFFEICWKSRKWEKWVSADFDPHADPRRLVLICGHYVFSDPAFQAIVTTYTNADTVVQAAIHRRLNELYSISINNVTT